MGIDISDSGFVNRVNQHLAKKFPKPWNGFFKDKNGDKKLQINEVNAGTNEEKKKIYQSMLELKMAESKNGEFEQRIFGRSAQYKLNEFSGVSYDSLTKHWDMLKSVLPGISFYSDNNGTGIYIDEINVPLFQSMKDKMPEFIRDMIQQIIDENSIVIGNHEYHFYKAHFYPDSNKPLALIIQGENLKQFAIIFFDREGSEIGRWNDLGKEQFYDVQANLHAFREGEIDEVDVKTNIQSYLKYKKYLSIHSDMNRAIDFLKERFNRMLPYKKSMPAMPAQAIWKKMILENGWDISDYRALQKIDNNQLKTILGPFAQKAMDETNKSHAAVIDQIFKQHDGLLEISKNQAQLNRLKTATMEGFLKSESKSFKEYVDSVVLRYLIQYSGYKPEQRQPSGTIILNLIQSIKNKTKLDSKDFLKMDFYQKYCNELAKKYGASTDAVQKAILDGSGRHDLGFGVIAYERLPREKSKEVEPLVPSSVYVADLPDADTLPKNQLGVALSIISNEQTNSKVLKIKALLNDLKKKKTPDEMDVIEARVGKFIYDLDSNKSSYPALVDFIMRFLHELKYENIIVGKSFEAQASYDSWKSLGAFLFTLPIGRYKYTAKQSYGDQNTLRLNTLTRNEILGLQNSPFLTDWQKWTINQGYRNGTDTFFVKDLSQLSQRTLAQKYLMDSSLKYLPVVDVHLLDQNKVRQYYLSKGMTQDSDVREELRLAIAHNLFYQKKDPTVDNMNQVLEQMNVALNEIESQSTYAKRSVLKYQGSEIGVDVPNWFFKVGNADKFHKAAKSWKIRSKVATYSD